MIRRNRWLAAFILLLIGCFVGCGAANSTRSAQPAALDTNVETHEVQPAGVVPQWKRFHNTLHEALDALNEVEATQPSSKVSTRPMQSALPGPVKPRFNASIGIGLVWECYSLCAQIVQNAGKTPLDPDQIGSVAAID
ncbi:MAG: hypothetical protein JNM18_08140 [Planctomycetaceae bacterium]|nr:hypothetical protein [Planctomycetaceae bacterium]